MEMNNKIQEYNFNEVAEYDKTLNQEQRTKLIDDNEDKKSNTNLKLIEYLIDVDNKKDYLDFNRAVENTKKLTLKESLQISELINDYNEKNGFTYNSAVEA